MKKIIALLMALCMLVCFAACTETETTADDTTAADDTTVADDTTAAEDTTAEEEDTTAEPTDEVTVMTKAEFDAAEVDSKVCVETYIQAKQGWWENEGVGVATFYTQNEDGAYFLYNMPCTEEDYGKLVAGTKIKVTGFKSEWSGEVEITDATYEIIDGSFTAEAFDATELLGTDDLIKHQNEFVAFKGMTVKSIEFKNGEPGDDIYVKLTKGDADYDFCVESYLTGPDSDLYKAVSDLKADDVIDVEGFLYWYNGVNTHITAVAAAE